MGIYKDERGFTISPDMYEKDTGNDILIRFQAGISKEIARNGIDIEELIELALFRLKHYDAILPSRENRLAITKLQEAGFWLNEREKDRESRNVTGTKQK